jgi:aerobic-type carbon monoxide dehydrogenase small subunit (CoxS/CutS family)
MADETQRGTNQRGTNQRGTNQRGLTRRSLFQGAGLVAAGSAILRPLEALAGEEAEAAARVQGPEAVRFAVEVNGKPTEVACEPRETLLSVLRLPPHDLTGAKPACDRGQCGACTVWLDGLPVYACMVLAVEAEGRKVTTVEGLGDPQRMDAVQAAFVQEDALQCGFCTPGLVMSCAHAVRTHGKDLTEEQVREATSGNLCRCGTYPHVLRAALAAARR